MALWLTAAHKPECDEVTRHWQHLPQLAACLGPDNSDTTIWEMCPLLQTVKVYSTLLKDKMFRNKFNVL